VAVSRTPLGHPPFQREPSTCDPRQRVPAAVPERNASVEASPRTTVLIRCACFFPGGWLLIEVRKDPMASGNGCKAATLSIGTRQLTDCSTTWNDGGARCAVSRLRSAGFPRTLYVALRPGLDDHRSRGAALGPPIAHWSSIHVESERLRSRSSRLRGPVQAVPEESMAVTSRPRTRAPRERRPPHAIPTTASCCRSAIS